jgi:hypothetical protein
VTLKEFIRLNVLDTGECNDDLLSFEQGSSPLFGAFFLIVKPIVVLLLSDL